MKAITTTITATITAALVMGLSIHGGAKTRMDYDQKASFDHLVTYSWATHQNVSEVDNALAGSLVSERIRRAIESELANMGYEKVEPGEADFFIDYNLSSEEKTEVSTFGGFDYGYGEYPRYYGYRHHGYGSFYSHGYGYANSGYGANTTFREILKVTLTLSVIDAETNAVIWRSWATKSLKQNPTPRKVRKFIKRSVHKTLKEFPPEALDV